MTMNGCMDVPKESEIDSCEEGWFLRVPLGCCFFSKRSFALAVWWKTHSINSGGTLLLEKISPRIIQQQQQKKGRKNTLAVEYFREKQSGDNWFMCVLESS